MILYVAKTSYARVEVDSRPPSREDMIKLVDTINPDEFTVEGTVVTDEEGNEVFEW